MSDKVVFFLLCYIFNLYLNDIPFLLDREDKDAIVLPNGTHLNCLLYADNLVLRADHLTSEEEGGWGGLGDFEKNILQVHMHKKKNSCTRPSCQKKFMHAQ